MHAAIHAAGEIDLNPIAPFGDRGMSLLGKSQPLPDHVTFRVSSLFVVLVVVTVVLVVLVIVVVLVVVVVVLDVVLVVVPHSLQENGQ